MRPQTHLFLTTILLTLFAGESRSAIITLMQRSAPRFERVEEEAAPASDTYPTNGLVMLLSSSTNAIAANTDHAMRVYKFNSGGESNIAWTAQRQLDVESMTNWLGTSNGLVTTWVDQWSTNDVVQVTESLMPRIYDGASVEDGVYFDGVLDYLDGPTFNDLPETYNFTISFWFNPDGYTLSAITFKGTDDLAIYPNASVGTGVRIYWKNLGGNIISDAGTNDRSGSWTHVAFISRASNDHQIFINGIGDVSSSATGTAGPFSEFYIGKYPGQGYGGFLDDILIYDRALTTNEIFSIYTASTNRFPNP